MAYRLICAADYHQGSHHFSVESRGKQCLPNCLIFLMKAKLKNVSDWSKTDLHSVMHGGDYVYNNLRSKIGHSYLSPEELPKCVLYNKTVFHFFLNKTYSGTLNENFTTCEPNITCLETALTFACCGNYNGLDSFCILVVQENAIGIHYDGSQFFIFDSHARGNDGMCFSSGTSVVGVVATLGALCLFLRNLVQSFTTNCIESIQYDLHSVKLTCSFSLHSYHYSKCKIIKLPDFENTDLLHETPERNATDATNISFSTKRKQDSNSYQTSKRVKVECGTFKRPDKSVTIGKARKRLHMETDFPDSIVKRIDSDELNGNISRHANQKFFEPRNNIDRICNFFHSMVASGPEYVCSCCTQTFFKHTVHQVEKSIFTHKDTLAKCLTGFKSVSGLEWICTTCSKYIKNGNIPPFSVFNGLKFPSKPDELELTQLEERLVSPRLTFMQLRELPRGGQLSVKGNIVNVPADVNTTVKTLPRMLNDSETIYVKFKRKLGYKHHISFEKIRPNKVLEAAQWLVNNSPLFRKEGIKVDHTWLNRATLSPEDDVENDDDNTQQNRETNSKTVSENECDVWTEDEEFEQRPTGNLDTVLQPVDFREFNQILSLAPGEGNTPLGLFQDIYSEFLAFPSIYCGQVRPDNNERAVPIHYSTICKWELRSVDRRVAMCVPNIFFKLKKLQIKQIRDKVTLAIRKCKTQGRLITVGEILSPGGIDKILKQDEGYRILRTLRGSPPYWEHTKKEIFAMIRQIGIPTWFCSFSAAETKWEPLLKTLFKLVYKREPSTEEMNEMDWFEKCHLIKSDPVTCTRYFEHRVQAFILYVLKDPTNPIGEITDYFFRVEFQQRGSPHIHMLIWIKDAPKYGQDDDVKITNFIDKHVTCERDQSIPQFVNYQTHRHARSCRKRGKAACRFNFPLPPMPNTMILKPLDENVDKKQMQKEYEHIVNELNKIKHDSDVTLSFDEFLSKLNLSFDSYILAVRSVLKSSKVFLKRSVHETRVNNYNTILLKSWEANLDIQFVLDPYACVSYIVSYISKGQRGMSNLLSQACKEARAANNDIKQQVRRIGNQFLNHVEIGAQEAAYLVLQMPLSRSTRKVEFIDTNPPDKRTVLLKSMSKLEELKKDSTNIESDNTLKRYMRRPRKMNSCCYADFVSWYTVVSMKKDKMKRISQERELPEDEYAYDMQDDMISSSEDDSEEPEGEILFKDGTVMRRRKKQKIIRYVGFSLNSDEANHYRELIMLFTSWRNENHDLLHGCETYKQSYYKMKECIDSKRRLYEKMSSDLLDEATLNPEDEIEEHVLDNVTPEIQHQENLDAEEGASASSLFGCFDPGEGCDKNLQQYDIGQDIGIQRKQPDDTLPCYEMSDDQYRKIVQTLNVKQKQYLYHVLHWFKTKTEPLYSFLTGGAGVGKSVVLKALYQALLKYFNHQAGENPDEMKILLCAPTGKAAHNIGGNTIHSSFCIPVGRGFGYKPLDMQQLNTLRCKYHRLKVVFIDEISMVGKNMFNFINLRLQEVKDSSELFGGVSVIAVGDLFQLKPIFDCWIFSQSSNSACDIQRIATNLWIDNFSMYELDEIMRQKDDLEFAQLLNRLREGNQNASDITMLKSRLLPANCSGPEFNYDELPHLFTTRAEVMEHNKIIFSKLPITRKLTVEAIDNVSGDLNAKLMKIVLSKIPDDESVTMGLHKSLCLGLDVPSELCVNINVDDGMTNGTPCVVKRFDFRVENSSRCSIIWVSFEESSIGSQWRQKYSHLYNKDIEKDWTPILELTRNFNVQYYKTYTIVRRQFPIHMAAAKTIHKSQGSTMKGAVVHFGTRKQEHMHYVGLSRVQNLSSLHILHLNEEKISLSNAVIQEMHRLRNESLTDICLPGWHYFCSQQRYKICFQNCRSLQKHLDDVKCDNNFQAFDVVAFSESHIHASSIAYEIPGFNLQCSDYHAQAHGMALYTKHKADYISRYFDGVEVMVTKVFGGINLCFIYCSPRLATLERYKYAFTQLLEVISFQDPTIVMGDFNQDILQGSSLSGYLQNMYNFKQLLHSPTTDYGSCLDHIYMNFYNPESHHFGTLESYYSDHKPIYILLNTDHIME